MRWATTYITLLAGIRWCAENLGIRNTTKAERGVPASFFYNRISALEIDFHTIHSQLRKTKQPALLFSSRDDTLLVRSATSTGRPDVFKCVV